MFADRLFNALERNEPAPGQLLVSAPGMLSPEFARSVILLVCLLYTSDAADE